MLNSDYAVPWAKFMWAFAAAFTFFIGWALLVPIFPLYLHKLHASDFQIGLVMGSFSAGVLVMRPFIGNIDDRLGLTKMMICGALINIVTVLLYLMTTDVMLLIPIRVAHGVGLSLFSVASLSLSAELAPAKRKAEILGYYSMATAMSFSVGPVIGDFLYRTQSMVMVFIIASAINILAIFFVWMCSRKEPHILKNRSTAHIISFWKLFSHRPILLLTILLLFETTAFGAVVTFIPLKLQVENNHLSSGAFFGFYGLVILLVRFFLGKVPDKVGHNRIIPPMVLLAGAGMLLAGGAITPLWHFAAATMTGIAVGLYLPSSSALITELVTDAQRTRAFSLYYGAYDLGMTLGAVIFGGLAAIVGYSLTISIASVLPIILAFVLWRPVVKLQAIIP